MCVCVFGCYVFVGSDSRKACKGKQRRGGAGAEGGRVLAGWEHQGAAGERGVHLKCMGTEVDGP